MHVFYPTLTHGIHLQYLHIFLFESIQLGNSVSMCDTLENKKELQHSFQALSGLATDPTTKLTFPTGSSASVPLDYPCTIKSIHYIFFSS